MRSRLTLLFITLVMTAVALGVAGTVIHTLYRAAFDEERQRLAAIAQSQARFAEAVARFDARYSEDDVPGGAFAATLSQIRDAHARFPGFGETGEFALARREGDRIVFLIARRHEASAQPEPLAWSSELAEPMRRALLGQSGTMIGLDYRGELVLAAHEPVGVLNLGIVAKIDLGELRAPFMRAGFLSAACALVFVSLGALLIRRLGIPSVRDLEESESKYRTLYDSATDGVTILTDFYEECNDQMCRILGYDRSEIIGRHPAELSPPRQRDGRDSREVAAEYVKAALTGTPQLFHWTHRRKDGSLIDTEISLKAIELKPRKVLLATMRDITERLRSEEALRESEKRFRSVADCAPDAIISADRDGNVVFWNQRAQSMFGYREDEIAGKPVTLLMPERYRRGHEEWMGRYLATGEARYLGTTTELEGLRKDGTEFSLELSLSSWQPGEEISFSAIIRDISERKNLEEQLRRSQRLEAIGQLAGGLAHDLNNILTTIMGYSEMLARGLLSRGEVEQPLNEIRRAAERAASLTGQLLAFGRRQMLEPRVLNANEVIETLEDMLRRLLSEDIELVLDLDRDLGMVEADPSQVEQVMMNLVVNASDAMPDGGKLTIETRNTELSEEYVSTHLSAVPGRYVMIGVADDGVGMDKETQARIFDPFFTTKETGKGSGLGLSTVYGIVQQSGGNIWVYSELEVGTTFQIYLPRVDKVPEPIHRASIMPETFQGSETVLLVEDDEAVRKLVRKNLEAYGYTVLESSDGEGALATSEHLRGPIDLLLTDLVMPRMSGSRLADHLKTARPDMKVLYMSGHTGEAVIRHGVWKPGTHLLRKPFTAHDLALRVREVLSAGPEPRSRASTAAD